MKTKILADFQICISVPLSNIEKFEKAFTNWIYVINHQTPKYLD